MSFEKLDYFGNGGIGLDVGAYLDAIASIDGAGPSTIAALRPSPLAVAVLDARRPCGITAARTFRGVGERNTTSIGCPPQHFLFTIALADSHVSLANDCKLLVQGIVASGTACVTAPGERLEMQAYSECDLLHLAVPSRLLRTPSGRRYDLGGLVLHDTLIGRIGGLLGEAPASWLRVHADLLSQLAITRLLQLARDAPPSSLPAWRLKKVKAFIETSIAEPLRLGDLADAAGLSRMHFAAQFRAVTGMRPHDYVLSRRIEHAKRSMAAGESALVEVALDAGFQSQAHFCTIFKRLTGVTPSVWRRQSRSALGTPTLGPTRVCAGDRAPASAFLAQVLPRLPASLGPGVRPA